MIELLSLIVGGLLRLIPEYFKFRSANAQNDHEFRMTTLQFDIDKARSEAQLDLVHAASNAEQGIAELKGMIEAGNAQLKPTGIRFVDALNSLVRPVLTFYWCVGLYTTWKIVQIYILLKTNADAVQYLSVLVSEFDRSIIGSIFAFWFVDRSLRK